uniref:2TM domain-containing protein n=1 Tax=Chromera velia CCMP2878 TaxID=1169474 RepID=A0A0G4G5S0_9ALVE|mmetsp:Transcript_54528/g.106668  ORF Transcript_54528/g.106668 Transcript_54528/m.106668 type:complete len:120 (-) Transcript_54528:285-644(-)|eukprot:Cvel_4208.t1-p1 / transcript=Cvel_4208.t1 / gene=Cvel_4208 / organism=Chromera_velia_CCMP2878 / gene_product=hypothetical protein / transcript_product=hypothetical protein / location=Cvel_scaffold181:111726-114183(-) / protein_length=119 / sequence_SO=supercontig / SO=protein_coding / is_pseudo=false
MATTGGGSFQPNVVFLVWLCHFYIWAAISAFLAVINLITTLLLPPWFLFPAVGWGFAVAIHAGITHVLVGQDHFTRGWESLVVAYIPEWAQKFGKKAFEDLSAKLQERTSGGGGARSTE